MTDTLFDIVYRMSMALDLHTGTATNGSTTTIVDTTLLTQTDDYWNKGLAMIITDAGGASAAPEKEWGIISDFDNGTNTVTMGAVTAAVAAGDIYGLLKPRFSLDKLRNAINMYLSSIEIPAYDKTSLDSADDQTEYDLPTAIPAGNLRRVYYQTNTGDANDNRWSEIRTWQVIMTGTGSQDTLILPQLPSSRDIMLEYVKTHPALYDSDDNLDEQVNIMRVVYAALQHVFAGEIAWEDNFKNAVQMANYYGDLKTEYEQRYPIHLPPRNGKIISHPHDGLNYIEDVGEVGKVSLS